MTKPKIANGNCLNPISRLEKRFDEYKRCHHAASKNCIKAQEAHNKSSDALKALLEKKSKLSDNKIKKKRSAASTIINRKKPKLNSDQAQTGSTIFETRIETTPNVTLNVHSSEIPDIDWDSFDILNNPNFSMSINEQDLEGVLNNCYSAPDTKTVPNPSDLNPPNACKTSPATIVDPLFVQNTANTFPIKDSNYQPLFPPPETHPLPCPVPAQNAVKYEYLSPQNYLPATTCAYNATNNVIPQSTNQNAVFNSLYPINVPGSNGTNSLSYQYHNPLRPESNIVATTGQYFYQYPNYGGVRLFEEHHSGANTMDGFQLPAMSTGWYNNNSKPTNCIKQPMVQQQQQFANPSVAIGNYRQHYGQYHQMTAQQDNSQIQYHPQMFAANHTQSYDCPITNYGMMPEQTTPQQYYYMDYDPVSGPRTVAGTNSTTNTFISTNNNNNGINNRHIIGQNDSRFLSQPTNPIICRNIYP